MFEQYQKNVRSCNRLRKRYSGSDFQLKVLLETLLLINKVKLIQLLQELRQPQYANLHISTTCVCAGAWVQFLSGNAHSDSVYAIPTNLASMVVIIVAAHYHRPLQEGTFDYK